MKHQYSRLCIRRIRIFCGGLCIRHFLIILRSMSLLSTAGLSRVLHHRRFIIIRRDFYMICELLGRETLQDITREDIFRVKKVLSVKSGKARRHQKSKGLSPDTINQYLQVFRQYIEYARNVRYEVKGFLPCETALTPIRTTEKIAGGRYVPDALTPYQVAELLGILKEFNLYLWAMMVAVWCTVRRPAQLACIRWRD